MSVVVLEEATAASDGSISESMSTLRSIVTVLYLNIVFTDALIV